MGILELCALFAILGVLVATIGPDNAAALAGLGIFVVGVGYILLASAPVVFMIIGTILHR